MDPINTNPIIPPTTPPPVSPNQPQVKASYSNEIVPSQGTPEYIQAQKLASQVPVPTPAVLTPTKDTTTTVSEPYKVKENTIQSQMQQNQDAMTTATTNFNNTVTGIMNGSVPLTPFQQSFIDSTKSSFQNIIKAQEIANKNFIGGTTVAQEARGLSRYSPEIAVGNIFAATTEANQKIADLNTKMNLNLSQIQQGFQEGNYKMVKDSYTELQNSQKERQATLEKMYTIVQNQEKEAVKKVQDQTVADINSTLLSSSISEEEKKKRISNLISSGNLTSEQIKEVQATIRQVNQDDITNKLNSDKFSWQQKQDIIDNAIKKGDLDLKQAQLALDRAKAGLDPTGKPIKAKSDLLSTVGLIDTILNNPNLSSVTGLKSPGGTKIPWSDKTVGSLYGSDTVEVSNQLNQLISLLSLENRQKLKGSGAISDFESKTLEKAASSFSTGLSDVAAVRQLHQIKGALSTAAGLKASVKIQDPKTGEFNIISSNREGIDKAIEDGLLVEYQ